MSGVLHGNPDGVYATIIEDSISPAGDRLTTMEVQCHRFVLAEFNTHRAFSRNSASSRAIPVKKQLQRVRENTAYPLAWPAEQRGMQGGEELSEDMQNNMAEVWRDAALHAADIAEGLAHRGLHKSITNRLLEPFMWHKIIVSSTEWDNFFHQRVSPLAQPEIRAVATEMQIALNCSVPKTLAYGDWHTPYITEEDIEFLNNVPMTQDERMKIACEISSARCARVSYLTHDGKRSLDADMELFGKLIDADPRHTSPTEHVATPAYPELEATKGNFRGWTQLRQLVEEGVWAA